MDNETKMDEMTLRDHFATQCDVMAYNPLETFKHQTERTPRRTA